MASHSIAINCTADTYVNRNNPSVNNGTSGNIRIGGWYLNNSYAYCKYVSILGFDLSSIPKNKTIKNIALCYYVNSISAEESTSTGEENNTSYPFVATARRLFTYNISEIETILNGQIISAKSGDNNLIDTRVSGYDSSLNISYSAGSFVSMSLNDITRPEDDKVIVGLRIDDVNYRNARSGRCTAFLSSREGVNKPYLFITYDDYEPQAPTDLSPNYSTRNKNGSIKLSWKFEDLLTGTSQASYEIIYSKDNFVTSSSITGTTTNNGTIPANVFSIGNTVQWKVRVTDTNGDVSAWSDIASFTIGPTIPSTPEPITPNSIVNSGDEIYFRWKFVDQYGYSIAKYDIEYKKGTDEPISISNTSLNNYHVLSAKTLSGGDYSWRVRTYNTFNEVGPYSEWTSFYSIGQPNLPSITSISNSMHPIIKWTSTEQDLFLIKLYKNNLIIFNSGEQPSKLINEYTIEEFISNGTYKVGLQISNVYGFWSNEVFANVTISAAKPSKPSISGDENNLYVALIIGTNTEKNLIYRKGSKDSEYSVITTLTNNNMFLDYSVNAGINQYYVRSITATGFNDSDVITLGISFEGIILADKENQSDLINLYYTKDIDKRKSIAPSKTQYKVNCSGRRYPLLQSTEFKNHSESHEYFIKYNDFDRFYRISSECNTVLYRNNYGYSYIAEMSNITIQEDIFGYIVIFTLSRLEE